VWIASTGLLPALQHAFSVRPRYLSTALLRARIRFRYHASLFAPARTCTTLATRRCERAPEGEKYRWRYIFVRCSADSSQKASPFTNCYTKYRAFSAAGWRLPFRGCFALWHACLRWWQTEPQALRISGACARLHHTFHADLHARRRHLAATAFLSTRTALQDGRRTAGRTA